MNDDFEAMARAAFVGESEDMLRDLERCLFQLGSAPGNASSNAPQQKDLIDAAFRSVHTLKGSGGIFGMRALVRLAHHVETCLDALRSGALDISPTVVAILLAGHDRLQALCEESSPEAEAEAADLGDRIAALTEKQTSFAGHVQVGHKDCWHISWRPSEPLKVDLLAQLQTLRMSLESVGLARFWPSNFDASVEAGDADVFADCVQGFEALCETDAEPSKLEVFFEPFTQQGDCVRLRVGSDHGVYATLLARRAPDTVSRESLMAVWNQMGLNLRDRMVLHHSGQSLSEPRQPPAGQPVSGVDALQSGSSLSLASPKAARGSTADGPSVRVGAAQLDELIERIAVVSTSVASVNAQASRSKDSSLVEAARQAQTDMAQAREDALALRMISMGEVFARFPRLVRELGLRLQREVELIVNDGDAEIDRAMVDAIVDPITHLIRNSMDHGIELSDERLRKGKPARGHISLSASRDGGYVVIELRDDGRGLDRDRILARATERGLVQFGSRLTDEDVLRLICLPGFSTAQAVTDVSGRGVGMDVVKRQVESLHGEMRLWSEPGQGTCVTVRIPMTLALLDAFCVQVQGATYLMPMDVVVECVDPPNSERSSGGDPLAAKAVLSSFLLRGDLIALADLRCVLTLAKKSSNGIPVAEPGSFTDTNTATAANRAEARQRPSVVVARVRGKRLGLVVDKLLGEQAVVIKSLGPVFADLRAFSGAAVLADGTLATVLDVAALQDLLSSATESGEASFCPAKAVA